MKSPRVVVLAIAFLLVSPLFAEEAAKKKGKGPKAAKGPASAMLSKLKTVELTAEQKEKLEKLAGELNTTMASLREAGLTPEFNKQKAEATKKAREEGKKGKDLKAAVETALNLTEAQEKAMLKASAAQSEFQKGVASLLTDEQIASLPEALQKQLKQAKTAGAKPPKKQKKAA